jgi:hypothetical protein
MSPRNLRHSVLVAMAFALFAGVSVGCRDAGQQYPADRVLSLFPSDTAILVGIRVSAFADTDVMKRIEEDVREAEGLGPALEKTGMTVPEAVHSIYLAVPPDVDPRKSDAPGRATAVLDTALDDDFLSEALSDSKHEFRREEVEGVDVWVNRTTPVAVALASLKRGVIAFGPFDAVRDVVLRSKRKLDGLSKKSSLFAKAGDVRTDAAFWAIIEMTPTLVAEAQKNPMTAGLNAVHHLVFSADYSAQKGLDVRVRGVCNTESDAGQVKQSLDVLTGLAGMLKNVDPRLEDILDTLVVETDKNVAQALLTLSPEALTAFLQRSQEREPTQRDDAKSPESKP